MDFGNSTDGLEFKPALLLLSCELMQWHHPYRRKLGRIEEPLEESEKKKIEKAGLKLNIQKMKIMVLGPITSWQIDGLTMETVTDFIFLGSIITGMVTAAMKLKDACSLEEKLWQI